MLNLHPLYKVENMNKISMMDDGDNSTTVLNQTVFDIAEYMPFNELMQYRAIIDIDGNT